MRLPMQGEDVDIEQTKQMVDTFLAQGFNYFDTAHGYIQGKSELALKECLTSRHNREDYILTNKLSEGYFKAQADIRPFFQSQLEACGVDYFDFYLMHSQGTTNYQHFKDCRAYETAFELKAEGKVRHVGISFHDRAEVLDQILTEYPQVEVVQIQFNYLDYDDIAVQSRKCYEVCRKHDKPVLVMEPVKGGSLVNLPDDAKKIFDDLHGGSPASYAIRFAAGFPGMMIVLSGMSNLQQMEDNLAFMRDFKPLNETELAAVKDFTVGKEGDGEVCWEGETDVRGLDLDERVLIGRDLNGVPFVQVYPPEVYLNVLPPEGVELNKRARVSLFNLFPRGLRGDAGMERFAERLRRQVEASGGEWVDYDIHRGILQFIVNHFWRVWFD